MFFIGYGRCGTVNWSAIFMIKNQISKTPRLFCLRIPDPRFEEDCQGLQVPKLAIAHPIWLGRWFSGFHRVKYYRFLESHGLWWNAKNKSVMTWNGFPFSWTQVGLISKSRCIFQSGHIQLRDSSKIFEFAQGKWQNQLNWWECYLQIISLCNVLFCRFCLELWQLVSLPHGFFPEQEACAAEGFGPENNGYWPPYRLLDHSFSAVGRRTPKKVGAWYWWCVALRSWFKIQTLVGLCF